MAVEQDLTLDIRSASAAISRLDQQLSAVAANFKAEMGRAFGGLTQRVSVTANVTVGQVDTAGVAGAVEGAVDAADTTVTPTADTGLLAGQVEAGVDAADTTATVTADVSEVPGKVEAAVDAADTSVTVTADVADAAGAIAGLSAMTVNVNVAAQTTGVSSEQLAMLAPAIGGIAAEAGVARAGIHDLNTEAALLTGATVRSAGAVNGLSTAFGGLNRMAGLLGVGLGAGAAVAVTRSAIEAASDLAESTNKASVVFQESFGDIETFARNAAQTVGLSTQDAMEMTATFGNMLLSMLADLPGGAQKAADLSMEIVQLGADLASFNNLEIAGPEGTLAKLRSGLVGEIEPLRRMGISFKATDAEARAFKMGLADANGEISEGAKVLARLAIIQEQAKFAQGDFARTSDQLANSQRILSAEWRNMLATVGGAILPSVLDLVNALKDDAIPAFAELGEAILPAVASALKIVGSAFGALGPIIGAVATVLSPIAEVLDAFATGLAALPGWIIPAGAAIAGIVLLITQWETVAIAAMYAMDGLKAAMATALGPIGLIALAIGTAVTAFGFMSKAREKERAEIEKTRQAIFADAAVRQAATEVIEDQAAALGEATDATAKWLQDEKESRFVTKEQIDDLTRLGYTWDRLAQQMGEGQLGLERFTEAAIAAGEVTLRGPEELPEEFQWAAASVEDFTAALQKAVREGGDYQTLLDVVTDDNNDLIVSFIRMQEELNKAGKAQLDLDVVNKVLTRSQKEYAIEVTRSSDGLPNYAAAADFAASHVEDLVAATGEATEAQARFLGQIELAVPHLVRARVAWDALAQAILDGSVTTADYQAIAERFGVSAATIEDFAARAKEAFGEFVQDALGTIPETAEVSEGFVQGIEDAISGMQDAQQRLADAQRGVAEASAGGLDTAREALREARQGVADANKALEEAIDPARLLEALQAQQEAMTRFRDNVNALIAQGNERAALEALKLGPQVGSAYAASLVDAGPMVATAADQALRDTDASFAGLATDIAANAPTLFAAAQQAGASIAQGMGVSLTGLPTSAVTALDEVARIFTTGAGDFDAAVRTLAESGGQEFIAGLKLKEATGQELDAMEQAIIESNGRVNQLTTGRRIGHLTPEDEAAIRADTRRQLNALWPDRAELEAEGEAAGHAVGATFSAGAAQGIREAGGQVEEEAAGTVGRAERAARHAAQAQSPSLLFARLGQDLAAGIGVGFLVGAIPLSEQVRGTLTGVVAAATADAYTAGDEVGGTFAAGVVVGLVLSAPDIEAAVRQAVRDAKAAAMDEAEARSPSRLFYEVGESFTAGIVAGLNPGDVERAVRQTVSGAVAAASAEVGGVSVPTVTVDASRGTVRGTAAAVSSDVTGVVEATVSQGETVAAVDRLRLEVTALLERLADAEPATVGGGTTVGPLVFNEKADPLLVAREVAWRLRS